MPRPLSRFFLLFRPSAEALSAEEKDRVQVHRLLCLLGAVLVPLYGVLYKISNPAAFHPIGPRLLIALLFAGLGAASYVSSRVRQQFVGWTWGAVYALMGWVAVVSAANGFVSEYAVGLLLTYAVLIPVVGLGAESMRPVLWFLAFGLGVTVGGLGWIGASKTSPLIVIGSMATLALVEGVTVQAWLAARRRTRRRSDAMEIAAEGMAILDPDGTYVYVNEAHAQTYGYGSPEAFLGRSWKMCYRPGERERFEEEVMPQLYDEGSWRGEATGRRADGKTFPQSLTLTVMEDGGIICTVRDITARRERERRLRRAKEKAEEAAQLKSAMLANMSHEIRTPLTSIIGFAEALGDELEGRADGAEDTDPEMLCRFSGLIERGGRRLMDTLDAVLNLSQLESGEMELSLQPVNLNEEIREAAGLFESKAEEAEVDLRPEIPPETVAGRADEGGLRLAVRNLLSNAIKYTGEGGRVWVRAYRENGEAVLEVEDTGIGMEPETAEALFEPFRQASEGFGREYEGTGLGLAVTKQAVEEMGGTLEVETEKGKGSVFTVRLPKAESGGSR